jgi:hypothetical protein
MREDELKKDAHDVVRQLRSFAKKYDAEIEKATAWIGSVPALPCNETRQVLAHSLDIIEAFTEGNMSAVHVEAARAQKHISLAIFDCLSVLLQYHRDSTKYVVEQTIKNQSAAFAAMQTAISFALDEFRAIGDLPTEQHASPERTAAEIIRLTEADVKLIAEASLRLQRALEGIEVQYEKLAAAVGPDALQSRILEYQELSRIVPATHSKSSDT